MRVFGLILVTALLQGGAPAPQQPAEKGSIEGIVVSATTGEPLARAEVALWPVLTPQEREDYRRDGNVPDAPSVRTEGDGKFLFKDLNPRPYRIMASRNGFAQQVYGQKASTSVQDPLFTVMFGPATIIDVQPGQTSRNITFRMVQAGVISGRVRDSAGAPVSGAAVVLMRARYNGTGRRTLQQVDSAPIDDRGEYRFYWIPAGRYYLVVNHGAVSGFRGIVENSDLIPTFYPGTIDPERATPVEVQAGTELAAIDILLPPRVTRHRIRGRVIDGATGKAPMSAEIVLRPKIDRGVWLSGSDGSYAVVSPTTGAFEFRDVLPGAYWLISSLASRGDDALSPEQLEQLRTRSDLWRTEDRSRPGVQISVDVAGADLNDIVLTLTRGATVPVRLTVEGQELSSLKDADNIRVSLETKSGFGDGSGSDPSTPRLNSDGVARIVNVHGCCQCVAESESGCDRRYPNGCVISARQRGTGRPDSG